MSAITDAHAPSEAPKLVKFDKPIGVRGVLIFLAILAGGLFFMAYNIYNDIAAAGGPSPTTVLPFILLGVAMLIALGFEFVNGFHDTANAVATVIYTHSLEPQYAVVWSGTLNFLGVLTSHTLIGSIIGVGVANALLRGQDGTSGVDWSQVTNIGYALLLSPIFGFVFSALLLLIMKFVIRTPALYTAPTSSSPPPMWIRGLLVFTCSGVSFFHGSNDGQKGMGLIMLILIGVAPTAYALNRALPESHMADFTQASDAASKIIDAQGAGFQILGDPRPAVTDYVHTHKISEGTFPALAIFVKNIAAQTTQYGSLAKVPFSQVGNTRNDMYLASEALRFLAKDKESGLKPAEVATLGAYKKQLDLSTKFIPTWVKVVVALALGLGTMIGWKRIVVTVGEKIGKEHLTYGQGAAAEIIAMATIGAADGFGLPVSTTHVLSSGVAGTMLANGSGIQLSTLRNIAMAWVLTLPCAILLSGTLYFLFRQIF
jgi:PiT family inorganic phosphate transporter